MCTTFCEPSINFFWHGNSWWDLKRTDRAWSNADFSVWKRTIGTWNLLYPSFIIALFHWDHCPLGTSQTTIVPKGTIHTTLVQWVLLKLSIPHLSNGYDWNYPYHTCPMGNYPRHILPLAWGTIHITLVPWGTIHITLVPRGIIQTTLIPWGTIHTADPFWLFCLMKRNT